MAELIYLNSARRHCVSSSLYLLEPRRSGLGKASLASFGPTPKRLNEPCLNEPKRPSANATLLADERKSDLSGATLATVNEGPGVRTVA